MYGCFLNEVFFVFWLLNAIYYIVHIISQLLVLCRLACKHFLLAQGDFRQLSTPSCLGKNRRNVCLNNLVKTQVQITSLQKLATACSRYLSKRGILANRYVKNWCVTNFPTKKKSFFLAMICKVCKVQGLNEFRQLYRILVTKMVYWFLGAKICLVLIFLVVKKNRQKYFRICSLETIKNLNSFNFFCTPITRKSKWF